MRINMLPSNDSSQPPTLETAIAAFTDWRATRTHMTRIHQHLWDIVFKLEESYKTSKVLNLLGISGTQYHKEKVKHGLVLSEATSSPPFVPLNNKLAVKNTVPTSVIHSPSLVNVEYKRADGAMLVINGLTVDAVSKLIADFDRQR